MKRQPIEALMALREGAKEAVRKDNYSTKTFDSVEKDYEVVIKALGYNNRHEASKDFTRIKKQRDIQRREARELGKVYCATCSEYTFTVPDWRNNGHSMKCYQVCRECRSERK